MQAGQRIAEFDRDWKAYIDECSGEVDFEKFPLKNEALKSLIEAVGKSPMTSVFDSFLESQSISIQLNILKIMFQTKLVAAENSRKADIRDLKNHFEKVIKANKK